MGGKKKQNRKEFHRLTYIDQLPSYLNVVASKENYHSSRNSWFDITEKRENLFFATKKRINAVISHSHLTEKGSRSTTQLLVLLIQLLLLLPSGVMPLLLVVATWCSLSVWRLTLSIFLYSFLFLPSFSYLYIFFWRVILSVIAGCLAGWLGSVSHSKRARPNRWRF